MDQTDLRDEAEQLLRELRDIQRLKRQWFDEYVRVYKPEKGKPSIPGMFVSAKAGQRLGELREREREILRRLQNVYESICETDESDELKRELDRVLRGKVVDPATVRGTTLMRELAIDRDILQFLFRDAASSAESSVTTVDASVAALEKRIEDLARSLPEGFHAQLSGIRSDLDMLAQTTREQMTVFQGKFTRMYEFLEGATDIVAILEAKSHESRISSLEKRVDVLSGETATKRGLVEAIKSNWIAVLALVVAASLLILKILEMLGYFAA